MNRPLLLSLCALVIIALFVVFSSGIIAPSSLPIADQTSAGEGVQRVKPDAAQSEPSLPPSPAPLAVAPPASPLPASARSEAQPTAEAKREFFSTPPQQSVRPPTRTVDELRAASEPTDREQYAHQEDNPVKRAAEQPVSTFSVDVDTGSYAQGNRIKNCHYLDIFECIF